MRKIKLFDKSYTVEDINKFVENLTETNAQQILGIEKLDENIIVIHYDNGV